ncbi:hypothetical protein V6Z11_A02G043000 [Gossypium hirsutum]|uniref:Uncharacterized protein n=1 Tax=Gossypium hirsutum TaxID=3635 RepID=A0ABM2ZT47_GOSHI|nr:uncharacterized protein LOC121214809 [Gossypium hirsutum]
MFLPMSSLKTLAFLSIFLLLHLKIAKTDFLSPLLSPLFDDVCKEVECGRGKCKPSINGTLPFYVCECDPGWKQTFSDKHDHAHLKFLPCIVPNCSMNNVCSAAPSPAQEKASDTDQSAFDICRWTNCGGGSCNKTSPFMYDCRCSEGYFNLLNVSAFPCYRECTIELVLKAGLQCNMEPEACYCRDQQLSSSTHFAWRARMVFGPNEATDIAVLF